jgi:AraC-like DNA-binding protein
MQQNLKHHSGDIKLTANNVLLHQQCIIRQRVNVMCQQQKNEVRFFRSSRLKDVELRFSEYRQHAFEKHTHDTYSIGLIKNGRTRFFYKGQWKTAVKGEIVLINPGLVHACNPPEGSALTYYMLYIHCGFLEEIGRSLSGEKKRTPVFSNPLVRDKPLFRQLNKTARLLEKSAADLEIESLLVESLAGLLCRYGYFPVSTEDTLPGCAENIKRSQAYLLENLFRNISLEELSSFSGLSPYHFLREFRKHCGLPPHAYQLQERIHAAKKFLAEGRPIAQVAADTGFSDQSHFTRKFKTFVGATPRQYQSGKG